METFGLICKGLFNFRFEFFDIIGLYKFEGGHVNPSLVKNHSEFLHEISVKKYNTMTIQNIKIGYN